MQTFLVLSTSPEGKTLTPEQKAKTLKEVVPEGITLLKRDSVNDAAEMAKRIRAIAPEPVAKIIRSLTTKRVEDFAAMAQSGDRVILLLTDTWEQYLVA
ncbi:MAG: hypothetical protein Q7R93_00175 [bacterium]|nr:hypothetical protein [bacterium]